jgi:methionyl-tRNA synthetase
VDSYRYYFLREIAFGQDGSFSWESMVARHNADLANGLGNLAARVLAMIVSSFDGAVPRPDVDGPHGDLPATVEEAVARYDDLMGRVALTRALGAVWDIVGRANEYLVETEPWKSARDPERREETATVLYTAAETLRILAVLISPIMPDAADRLWLQLGIPEPLEGQRLPEAASWGGLRPGTVVTKGDPLFPRIEEEDEPA